MDFQYSQGCDLGATLSISPTHLRHVDSISPIRHLRRSMSRSPSKIMHFASFKQTSSSPIDPTPANTNPSPLRAVSNIWNDSTSSTTQPKESSGHSTKKMRPTLRRMTPIKSFPVKSTRSPIRRALSESSDQGNSGSSVERDAQKPDGQENCSPLESRSKDTCGLMDDFESPSFNFNKPDIPFNTAPQKTSQMSLGSGWPRPPRSSPLKRSDGEMNLDRPLLGSPSAKRRTICTGFLSSPFNLESPRGDRPPHSSHRSAFDHGDSSDDSEFRSPIAPRPSTARKPTSSRVRRSIDFASTPSARSKTCLKSRSRPSPESTVSPQRTTQSTRSPPRGIFKPPPPRPRQNPHPLSKALSPASPSLEQTQNASVSTESVFQSPLVPATNFSKSLPVGALRPDVAPDGRPTLVQDTDDKFEVSFATPERYKMAKPDPAAFRSTGLISKRHRNPEEMPPPTNANMPDTPCKRVPFDFSGLQTPTPDVVIARPRFVPLDFGTPSKVVNMHDSEVPQRTSAINSHQSSGLNQQYIQDHARRQPSFGSIDGDEPSHSPSIGGGESQSSADELPPTPTKQMGISAGNKQNSLRSSLFGRRPTVAADTFTPPEDSGPEGSFGTDHSTMTGTRTANAEYTDRSAPVASPPDGNVRANAASQSSNAGSAQDGSPHTPDSGLLFGQFPISFQQEPRLTFTPSISLSNSFPLNGVPARTPATPSSHRHSMPIFGNQSLAMTPSTHTLGQDVDPILSSRFTKAEWYARGEFSEVYKVYQTIGAVDGSYFATSFGSKLSRTPQPDKVYIVKKSKVPYSGHKIRQRKLNEVNVMRALGKSDHIVHLVDSWEMNGHLYIQTEFCEEGSLDAFLARTGHKGRLDDFRIWKILMELSQGIKHIHDSGFIHLDLKPANVFIDFEGFLKIGDFGHASEWPAPATVEGEGDRRYIGPDLLQGSFDKPGDIFALGMIMFEIAGNCIPPDNGVSWQKLRSGDWSGLPSLTSGSTNSFYRSSSDGLITSQSFDCLDQDSSAWDMHEADNRISNLRPQLGGHTYLDSTEDFARAPRFMLDSEDGEALDNVVHRMMLPNPVERPVINQILSTAGVEWVSRRRRAGAIVFEGFFGPQEPITNEKDQDAEMLDV